MEKRQSKNLLWSDNESGFPSNIKDNWVKWRHIIMKKYAISLTVVLLTTVMIMPAHPAMKKLAQTGLQFLKVDMSARAAAMGGAFMLIGNDANAMFYNPAGIAKMTSNFDFLASQTQWIGDITYSSAGVAKNFGNVGTFGASASFCNYGDIEGTRVANNDLGYEETGNVDVGAYVIGISYARNLSTKFAVGGQVKWVSQNLGKSLLNTGKTEDNSVSGLGYDFGTIFYPGFKSFRFGMSVRNFSGELKYQKEGFQLPLTFTIGVAMDVLDIMGEHKNPLLLAVDAIHPRDYSERINIGAEYLFMDMFALRLGYKVNYDEENFTAGVGFKKQVRGSELKVDYAYSAMDLFDAVNRFSVGFSF
jgi:hypothetical protein